MSRNLQLRLTTAIVGLPLILGLSYVGEWPFAIAIGLVGAGAMAEFTHGWLLPTQPLSKVIALWPGFVVVGGVAAGAQADYRFLAFGAVLGVAVAAAGYSRANQFGPRKPLRVFSWGIAYLGLPLACVVLVREWDGGRDWIFVALLATFAVDTGAYVTGKLIGRHKLAPSISPGKTIEGAIGGYAAGVGAVIGLNAAFDTGESALAVLPLALALPLVGQAGDLLESAMKRRMGIKDSSGLLPGHGGLLDRLDSIVFVMPLTLGYLALFVG